MDDPSSIQIAGVYCRDCGQECRGREHRDGNGRVIGVTWTCTHCRTGTRVGQCPTLPPARFPARREDGGMPPLLPSGGGG